MASTTHLKKITLHLARAKDHAHGSSRYGFEFVAPLDEHGHIDTKSWHEHRGACVVHRFWGHEPRMRGMLVHRAGGATWMFNYDPARDDDDEAGFHFGQHAFVPGEYVSVRDGEMLTYKLSSAVSA
jgi:hypothetical protein